MDKVSRGPLSSILAYVVFAILIFCPMLQLGKITIPTLLFLLPILFFRKNLTIDKKAIRLAVIVTGIMLATYIPTLMYWHTLTTKDVMFMAYPAYMVACWHIIYNLFKNFPKQTVSRCIKLFIIAQLVICLIQLTNFLDTNTVLRPLYMHWQSVNALKDTPYLEIAYRPFGSIGNPTMLAVIVYVLARIIKKDEGKAGVFYWLAILIIVISGSRTALLAVLIMGAYEHIIKNIIRKPIASIISFFAILGGIFAAISNVPFIKKMFKTYISGNSRISSDYSISYRLSMLDMFKDNTRYLLTGGYGIYNFPSYVDSEVILRLLQFGIVNLLLIISFYIYKIVDIVKKLTNKNAKSNFILTMIFLAFCSVTATVFTNLMIMQFILVYFVCFESTNKKELSL